ncbi:Rhomboid domain containing protein [Trichuris trichiura]|uniref:Rhomboid domain containing protein n=1 Tax=Trichuris trichiura TaxID=36087 RepID=A0A077Z2C0_TRITR|nr:Rhomboid domain containing protein [Trichuris trichiura]
MRRNRREIQIGVLLLVHELIAYGVHRVPPGTLALIVFQTLAYLGFIPVLDVYQIGSIALTSSATAVREFAFLLPASHCVHPGKIIKKKQLERLLFPTYMHADDMHLYYNMVSFLVKGAQLEPLFGTGYFLFLIVTFGVLINVMMVAMSFGLHSIGLENLNLMRQCAVGFSGVIFALKVLCQEYDPMGRQYGFFRRYRSILNLSCWSELLLIQLATPNASFVGHLCGIIVGLLYTRSFLKNALDLLYPGSHFAWRHGQPRDEEYANPYAEPMDEDEYTGGFSEQEQIFHAMRRSK